MKVPLKYIGIILEIQITTALFSLLYLVIDMRFTRLSFPYLETIQGSFAVKVNRLERGPLPLTYISVSNSQNTSFLSTRPFTLRCSRENIG